MVVTRIDREFTLDLWLPNGTKRLRVDFCGNAAVGYRHPPADPWVDRSLTYVWLDIHDAIFV